MGINSYYNYTFLSLDTMVIVILNFEDSGVYTYDAPANLKPTEIEDYIFDDLGFKESEISWMVDDKIPLFKDDEFVTYL